MQPMVTPAVTAFSTFSSRMSQSTTCCWPPVCRLGLAAAPGVPLAHEHNSATLARPRRDGSDRRLNQLGVSSILPTEQHRIAAIETPGGQPGGGDHMSANGHPTPEQIRSRLDHPVIDGDGHWVEFDPVFGERMRKVGGDRAADGFFAAMQGTRDALGMSLAERRRRRIAQPAFWSRQASNTLDRATAMMPRLLYERLPELGTDFAVIYPTAGLRLPRIHDDATRRAVVRAHNVVTAE